MNERFKRSRDLGESIRAAETISSVLLNNLMSAVVALAFAYWCLVVVRGPAVSSQTCDSVTNAPTPAHWPSVLRPASAASLEREYHAMARIEVNTTRNTCLATRSKQHPS